LTPVVDGLSRSLKRKSKKGKKDKKESEGIEAPVHRGPTSTATD